MTLNPKQLLRTAKSEFLLFYLSRGSSKTCPLCGWQGHSFLSRSYPYKPGPSSICPSCGSSARHRFAYFELRDKLNYYADATLQFAPEKCIEPWLRSISAEYLSVDLSSPRAMQHMDITDLTLENASFSLIWCAHVLEHIEDDNKAMAELFRVLRPSGLAVVMVPVYGDATYENPKIKSPDERLKHFKQADHVRLYGLDIQSRLEDVGFYVEVLSTSDLAKENLEKFNLDYPSTREIFLCTKPEAS